MKKRAKAKKEEKEKEKEGAARPFDALFSQARDRDTGDMALYGRRDQHYQHHDKDLSMFLKQHEQHYDSKYMNESDRKSDDIASFFHHDENNQHNQHEHDSNSDGDSNYGDMAVVVVSNDPSQKSHKSHNVPVSAPISVSADTSNNNRDSGDMALYSTDSSGDDKSSDEKSSGTGK